MEFRMETRYDQKTMKALARGLRKVMRTKRSKRSHRFGWIVTALGVVLMLSAERFTLRVAVTGLAVLAILLALLFEDAINGYVARKRGLPGLDRSVATFRQDDYHSATPLGESTFSYETIAALGETDSYFLFFFSPSHGQIYDKETLTGGTEAQFRALLEERTNLTFQQI